MSEERKPSSWEQDISMEARAVMAICVLIAVEAACLYHLPWAKAWMPGIAVGALTIGLTATVLQALIARAERRRVQVVVDAALERVSKALWAFLRAAANSWMYSNLGTFRDPLPEDLDGWIEFLVYEFPNADTDNPFLRAGISPLLLATALRDRLVRVTDRHVVVLQQQLPTLLVALDEFDDEMSAVNEIALPPPGERSPRKEQLTEVMHRALMAVRDFAEEYTPVGPPIPDELITALNVDLTERHADEVTRRVVSPDGDPALNGEPVSGSAAAPAPASPQATAAQLAAQALATVRRAARGLLARLS